MTVAFILLACSGLTFILKYGSILAWLRRPLIKLKFFEDLFDCALCLGFWSGVAVTAVLYYLQWEPLFILLPVASAAFSWLMDGVVGVFKWGELYIKNKAEKL